MHDSDVSVPTVPGATIPGVADDAAILNEAYDSYADALYAYCRSLVQEPAAAADAVRDAFVVAAFRLADVPSESLLRPWLFAVARNECLRAIGSGAATGAWSIFPDGEEEARLRCPPAMPPRAPPTVRSVLAQAVLAQAVPGRAIWTTRGRARCRAPQSVGWRPLSATSSSWPGTGWMSPSALTSLASPATRRSRSSPVPGTSSKHPPGCSWWRLGLAGMRGA